jgi:hypothetical protein
VDAAQVELLERNKRRIFFALCLIFVGLLVSLALRFVPRLNDALSGKPEYVRILMETFGRQLATQTQMQFPVIVDQDQHGTCLAVSGPSIPEEEIRGTIYLLTYSEQQNLTCISTYVVPMDASRFSTLRGFGPAEAKNFGPALLGPVKAGGSVSIDFDYGELRAEVALRHRNVNVALSWLLGRQRFALPFLACQAWTAVQAFFAIFPSVSIQIDAGKFPHSEHRDAARCCTKEVF